MSRTLPPNPLTDAQTDDAPLPLVAVRDRFSDWLFQKLCRSGPQRGVMAPRMSWLYWARRNI